MRPRATIALVLLAGWACSCVRLMDTPALWECQLDNDCLDGKVCKEDKGGYSASSTKHCRPPSWCSSDSQCERGLFCLESKSMCMTPGGLGGPCQYSSNCGEGLACDQDVCVAVGGMSGYCKAAADCAPLYECQKNRCTCTPHPETCNGIDDDCDGQIDEEFGIGASCYGTCGAGVKECATATAARCSTDRGGSQASSCYPSHCADGAKSGDELDVDCGGACSPCPMGSACASASDCLSQSCLGMVCRGAWTNGKPLSSTKNSSDVAISKDGKVAALLSSNTEQRLHYSANGSTWASAVGPKSSGQGRVEFFGERLRTAFWTDVGLTTSAVEKSGPITWDAVNQPSLTSSAAGNELVTAVAANGTMVARWESTPSAFGSVFLHAAVYLPGSGWIQAGTLPDTSGSSFLESMPVIDEAGNAAVAWRDSSGAVKLSRFDIAKRAWLPAESALPGIGKIVVLALAGNAAGDLTVVAGTGYIAWSGEGYGNRVVASRRPAGGGWGEVAHLAVDNYLSNVTASLDGAGRTTVVYSAGKTWRATIGASGAVSEHQLVREGGSLRAKVGPRGQVLLVWQEKDQDWALKALFHDPAGSGWQSEVTLLPAKPGWGEYDVDLAMNERGESAVLWSYSGSDETRISISLLR